MDLWDACNKIELALLNSVDESRAAIGGCAIACGMIIWTIFCRGGSIRLKICVGESPRANAASR